MKVFRAAAILALFLLAVLIPACAGGTDNANTRPPTTSSNAVTENANSARTNVEELTLSVNVPYDPDDIVWKQDAANKRIVAVLRFSPADANKLVAEAEKFGTPENVNVAVETWFPTELIAQGEMSGDNALRGLAYPANNFYQEPYSTGKITRIEDSDYFVLELNAR